MRVDHRGRRLYTEKQYLALCRGINWTYEGARDLCGGKAEHFIGDVAYGQQYRLGFCEPHWRALSLAIRQDIQATGDDLGHWIVDEVMRRHRNEYDELRARYLEESRATTEANIERLGRMSWGVSVVYFVQTGEDGPIKIGTSKNFASRLSMLQTGSPYTLRLLAITPGDGSLESEYHALFASHRLSGEWFEPVPEILAEIERINGVGEEAAAV